ncbi:hypothetical protein H0E87_012250 [Populus deltoides]|uniref:Protein kinase domain-containing protein n=1 Tax=Populus deltoides TaxID=3696 RepID=A0A8T2YIE6_POPDE|nr:hypothetical protein H0E87_012250 [Populus deltoides]
MRFPLAATSAILVVLALAQVQSLGFQFSNFTISDQSELILSDNSSIALGAIQVTPDANGASMENRAGRTLYRRPFRLWSKKGKNANFNTTFVLNVKNMTASSGEGLAFILTGDPDVPGGSDGQWLGIVNSRLNGTTEAKTVAIEFDTRKSFPEDLDDNHIGLDINSVYSKRSVSLNDRGIYISAATDIKVVVQYDGKNLIVFVGDDMKNPVLSEPLDLSAYLPEKVKDSKLRRVWILVAVGSVLILLIGIGTQEETLSWGKRLSVISGVAQALDYLHNGCMDRVLHRDIKASNVMLDLDFNAKLGDFGLARTIIHNEQTHHSTKELAGTPGYMAPESILTGRATAETDVYAFGVLVLEVACGRKPGGQAERDDYICNIVHGLWELYRRGTILEGADPRLNGIFIKEEMECVLILGLACCHPNPKNRPSMKTVLQVLTGEAPPPEVPAERPAFMWPPMPPSFNEWDNSLVGGQLSPFSGLSGR